MAHRPWPMHQRWAVWLSRLGQNTLGALGPLRARQAIALDLPRCVHSCCNGKCAALHSTATWPSATVGCG